MKISEVYPEYVFQRLGAGKEVAGVDFERKTYVDLAGMTVDALRTLIGRATQTGGVKFYQIEREDVSSKGEE